MPFTNFCCRSGGSNLNAGTRTGNTTEPGVAPALTYSGGAWNSATGVFTVASGNPATDGVAVGDFVSVYDSGNWLLNKPISTSRASTPDAAKYTPTNLLDARWDGVANWSSQQRFSAVALVAQYSAASPAYLFRASGGSLQFLFNAASATSAAHGITNDARYQVRVLVNASAGTVGFFKRDPVLNLPLDDDTNWTQIGVNSAVSAFAWANGTQDLTVGGYSSQGTSDVDESACKAAYLRVDGGAVAFPTFSAQTAGAATFSDPQGNLWTINSINSAIGPATRTFYIGRVTAVSSASITVADVAGTRPPTEAANRVLRVGGAWKGPNASEQFPFGSLRGTALNAAGDPAKINFKNDASFSISVGMTHTLQGPIEFEGYSTAYADGGKAIIEGSVSINVLTLTGGASGTTLTNLIFQHAAGTVTGTGSGLSCTSTAVMARGCVFRNLRGVGLSVSSNVDNFFIECEFYNCNASNTSTWGGAIAVNTAGCEFVRCSFHDNPGSNSHGLSFNGNGHILADQCTFHRNGQDGLRTTTTIAHTIRRCSFYANTRDGLRIDNAGAAMFAIESCIFAKNGGVGINGTTTNLRYGFLFNNAFGAGTFANMGGNMTGIATMREAGTIALSANSSPWKDADNGDFTPILVETKGLGRGSFTNIAAGYGGTISFPDIGAAQSAQPIQLFSAGVLR